MKPEFLNSYAAAIALLLSSAASAAPPADAGPQIRIATPAGPPVLGPALVPAPVPAPAAALVTPPVRNAAALGGPSEPGAGATVPVALAAALAAGTPPLVAAAVSPVISTLTDSRDATAAAVVSRQHWVPSRDTHIPATLVHPADTQQPLPLVLLLHGHGGTRHEAGGFTRLARALAERGIATIRMDFPGCGESIEPFRQNNLTNMLADARAARRYAAAQLAIDPERQGLVGFSMGGRVALHLAPELRGLRALTLWAPSATDGAAHLMDYVGGPQHWAAMRTQAAAQGYAPFTTFWGQRQQLGARWFTDLEASRPVPIIQQFSEALLVVYGSEDPVIPPASARAVVEQAGNARTAVLHEVTGADHGFGLFDNRPELTEETVRISAEFLAAELMAPGQDTALALANPARDAPARHQEPML
ncbi:MAG: alpha/beta fold hydrolase [Pseudomonadota bacterium]